MLVPAAGVVLVEEVHPLGGRGGPEGGEALDRVPGGGPPGRLREGRGVGEGGLGARLRAQVRAEAPLQPLEQEPGEVRPLGGREPGPGVDHRQQRDPAPARWTGLRVGERLRGPQEAARGRGVQVEQPLEALRLAPLAAGAERLRGGGHAVARVVLRAPAGEELVGGDQAGGVAPVAPGEGHHLPRERVDRARVGQHRRLDVVDERVQRLARQRGRHREAGRALLRVGRHPQRGPGEAVVGGEAAFERLFRGLVPAVDPRPDGAVVKSGPVVAAPVVLHAGQAVPEGGEPAGGDPVGLLGGLEPERGRLRRDGGDPQLLVPRVVEALLEHLPQLRQLPLRAQGERLGGAPRVAGLELAHRERGDGGGSRPLLHRLAVQPHRTLLLAEQVQQGGEVGAAAAAGVGPRVGGGDDRGGQPPLLDHLEHLLPGAVLDDPGVPAAHALHEVADLAEGEADGVLGAALVEHLGDPVGRAGLRPAAHGGERPAAHGCRRGVRQAVLHLLGLLAQAQRGEGVDHRVLVLLGDGGAAEAEGGALRGVRLRLGQLAGDLQRGGDDRPVQAGPLGAVHRQVRRLDQRVERGEGFPALGGPAGAEHQRVEARRLGVEQRGERRLQRLAFAGGARDQRPEHGRGVVGESFEHGLGVDRLVLTELVLPLQHLNHRGGQGTQPRRREGQRLQHTLVLLHHRGQLPLHRVGGAPGSAAGSGQRLVGEQPAQPGPVPRRGHRAAKHRQQEGLHLAVGVHPAVPAGEPGEQVLLLRLVEGLVHVRAAAHARQLLGEHHHDHVRGLVHAVELPTDRGPLLAGFDAHAFPLEPGEAAEPAEQREHREVVGEEVNRGVHPLGRQLRLPEPVDHQLHRQQVPVFGEGFGHLRRDLEGVEVVGGDLHQHLRLGHAAGDQRGGQVRPLRLAEVAAKAPELRHRHAVRRVQARRRGHRHRAAAAVHRLHPVHLRLLLKHQLLHQVDRSPRQHLPHGAQPAPRHRVLRRRRHPRRLLRRVEHAQEDGLRRGRAVVGEALRERHPADVAHAVVVGEAVRLRTQPRGGLLPAGVGDEGVREAEHRVGVGRIHGVLQQRESAVRLAHLHVQRREPLADPARGVQRERPAERRGGAFEVAVGLVGLRQRQQQVHVVGLHPGGLGERLPPVLVAVQHAVGLRERQVRRDLVGRRVPPLFELLDHPAALVGPAGELRELRRPGDLGLRRLRLVVEPPVHAGRLGDLAAGGVGPGQLRRRRHVLGEAAGGGGQHLHGLLVAAVVRQQRRLLQPRGDAAGGGLLPAGHGGEGFVGLVSRLVQVDQLAEQVGAAGARPLGQGGEGLGRPAGLAAATPEVHAGADEQVGGFLAIGGGQRPVRRGTVARLLVQGGEQPRLAGGRGLADLRDQLRPRVGRAGQPGREVHRPRQRRHVVEPRDPAPQKRHRRLGVAGAERGVGQGGEQLGPLRVVGEVGFPLQEECERRLGGRPRRHRPGRGHHGAGVLRRLADLREHRDGLVGLAAAVEQLRKRLLHAGLVGPLLRQLSGELLRRLAKLQPLQRADRPGDLRGGAVRALHVRRHLRLRVGGTLRLRVQLRQPQPRLPVAGPVVAQGFDHRDRLVHLARLRERRRVRPLQLAVAGGPLQQAPPRRQRLLRLAQLREHAGAAAGEFGPLGVGLLQRGQPLGEAGGVLGPAVGLLDLAQHLPLQPGARGDVGQHGLVGRERRLVVARVLLQVAPPEAAGGLLLRVGGGLDQPVECGERRVVQPLLRLERHEPFEGFRVGGGTVQERVPDFLRFLRLAGPREQAAAEPRDVGGEGRVGVGGVGRGLQVREGGVEVERRGLGAGLEVVGRGALRLLGERLAEDPDRVDVAALAGEEEAQDQAVVGGAGLRPLGEEGFEALRVEFGEPGVAEAVEDQARLGVPQERRVVAGRLVRRLGGGGGACLRRLRERGARRREQEGGGQQDNRGARVTHGGFRRGPRRRRRPDGRGSEERGASAPRVGAAHAKASVACDLGPGAPPGRGAAARRTGLVCEWSPRAAQSVGCAAGRLEQPTPRSHATLAFASLRDTALTRWPALSAQRARHTSVCRVLVPRDADPNRRLGTRSVPGTLRRGGVKDRRTVQLRGRLRR